ncbi:MAG: GNAT family N-acetyltransferase [Christensenellales bacterium]|jgi:RimJ/RimL family protein N-acetyltransferase
MDVTRLSGQYAVRRLQEDDIPAVFALCRENTVFYQHAPPPATPEIIRRDMQALPPERSKDDKYYLGFFDETALIAVLDVIVGYPDAETVFLGFFMLDISRQGQGIGSAIIQELCGEWRRQGYRKAMLGWAKDNRQAEKFWHKNGFIPTGVTDKRSNDCPVVLAEKALRT